jgi:hypothetical protein
LLSRRDALECFFGSFANRYARRRPALTILKIATTRARYVNGGNSRLAARLGVLAPRTLGLSFPRSSPPPTAIERHVSFEPNIAGDRVTARIDEPLEWPLLARLPRVGRGICVAHPAPAAPPLVGVDSSPANPGIDMLHRRPMANRHGQQTVGGPPRVVAEAFEWPDVDGGAAPTERLPVPPREYLRIDPADVRPGRGTHRRPPSHSLAARAYRWHAALAPHAGVAATVILILSATLLYWLTIGPGRTAGAYEDILDQQHTWSNDSPRESEIAVDQQNADAWGRSFDFTAPSSAFPRVADAAAEPSLSAAEPGGEAPVAAVESPASSEAPNGDDESAAVTPTPHTAPYPVTEYVSLDQALPGAVEPVTAVVPIAAEDAPAVANESPVTAAP